MSETSTEQKEIHSVVSMRVREGGLKELLKALGGERGFVRFPDVRIEHLGDQFVFSLCGNVGTLDRYRALSFEFDIEIPKELLENRRTDGQTSPPELAPVVQVPPLDVPVLGGGELQREVGPTDE